MASRTSLYSNNGYVQVVDPADITADTNSASVDMQGYEECFILANVGESGDTLSGSVYWELEVQESDDDSVWTAVADADLENSVTGGNTGTFAVIDDAAEDDARYITAYKGQKRYVRVVINATGTHTNGTPMSITIVQGRPNVAPVQ